MFKSSWAAPTYWRLPTQSWDLVLTCQVLIWHLGFVTAELSHEAPLSSNADTQSSGKTGCMCYLHCVTESFLSSAPFEGLTTHSSSISKLPSQEFYNIQSPETQVVWLWNFQEAPYSPYLYIWESQRSCGKNSSHQICILISFIISILMGIRWNCCSQLCLDTLTFFLHCLQPEVFWRSVFARFPDVDNSILTCIDWHTRHTFQTNVYLHRFYTKTDSTSCLIVIHTQTGI